MNLPYLLFVAMLISILIGCNQSVRCDLLWYEPFGNGSGKSHLIYLNRIDNHSDNFQFMRDISCAYLDSVSIGLPVENLVFISKKNVYWGGTPEKDRIDTDYVKQDKIRKNRILTIRLEQGVRRKVSCNDILYFDKGDRFNGIVPKDSTRKAYFKRKIENSKKQ